MSTVAKAIDTAERLPLPDSVLRAGVNALVARTSRELRGHAPDLAERFAQDMDGRPIATETDDANRQHYEIPPEFFATFLGARRKYSCCYFDGAATTLDEAEVRALALTESNADCRPGQEILELGCGWGSLTLWLAERLPTARIHAVSNSASQCAHIREQAAARGLSNVRLTTADMNTFTPAERYDRIVSVEMFEHMANWRALLERAMGWLKPDGRLFIHVFSHRSAPYRFDHTDPADWIARHFFAGGIMPSDDLVRHFDDLAEVEASWRWNGIHYARTARHWLRHFDDNRATLTPILRGVYGAEAEVWRRRWRLFFIATEGLFGFGDGAEWGVSHYRLKAPGAAAAPYSSTRIAASEPNQ